MTSRLQEKYMKEVAPALMEKFNYKNVMEIPKIDKIVINMGDKYQCLKDRHIQQIIVALPLINTK